MKLRKMKNKRAGILGGVIATFFAVIAIIAILATMVLIAGTVHVVATEKTEIKVYEEADLGINNLESYMRDFPEKAKELSKVEVNKISFLEKNK